MTHFLEDILRQPRELKRALEFLAGAGRPLLEKAADLVRGSRHVFLTGIGSSWHASLSAAPIFYQGACPVYLRDAADLLQFATLPAGSVVIIISRSGRSAEIVGLLAKVRECGATVIGLTNSEDGTLAREAKIPIVLPLQFDHAISVNTYSTLAAAAGALASAAVGSFDASLVTALSQAIDHSEQAIPVWRKQLTDSAWPSPGEIYYFLSRAPGLGSSHETRMLWEEGVKSPASAIGMGGFRHGPQEMVRKGARFGIWIDGETMREQDLAVARDLGNLGASLMLIGQDLPKDSGDLVFQLPTIPPAWQFLIDIIPAQLAAEHLGRLAGVDSDTFRLCSYIVEDEGGLLKRDT